MKQNLLSAATALCAFTTLPAHAQTTTIDNWSNHGVAPIVSVGQNSPAACGLTTVVDNPALMTDANPDNFASFVSLLSIACEASIRTSVLANPATTDVPASVGSPRYAGYFLGGNFGAVSALTDITLRTYDDGSPAETASTGSGIAIADLGDDNFFVYFEARAPFDDVEIEFGTLATAVENLEVYYAFATAGTGTFAPVSTVPLTLENTVLQGEAVTGGVRLSWNGLPMTCTRLVVEHSVDGVSDAKPIAALPATTLEYFDANATAGKRHIYRLRMEQADGSVLHSPSVSVFAKAAQGNDWTIYPNPATGLFHVRVAQSGDYGLTLRNAAGSVVYQQSYAAEAGKALTLSRAAMPTAAPGVYVLELSTPNGERSHQRILLQ